MPVSRRIAVNAFVGSVSTSLSVLKKAAGIPSRSRSSHGRPAGRAGTATGGTVGKLGGADASPGTAGGGDGSTGGGGLGGGAETSANSGNAESGFQFAIPSLQPRSVG